jgi:hypothetical protein
VPSTTTSTTTAGSGALPPVWTAVGTPYVIDPQAAAQLFNSYWDLRAIALLWDERSVLKEIESGAALTADLDSCGCGVISWGKPLAFNVFLTPQRSFPAYFMADAFAEIPGNATQNKAYVFLVFQRLSAGASWSVVIDSQQQVFTSRPPAKDIDRPVTDAQGYDVSPMIDFPGGFGRLSGQLAAYWEYWAVHYKGPASSIFWPGLWTTQHGREIAQDEQSADPTEGIVARYDYSRGKSSNAWVVPEQGYGIACGSLIDRVTFTVPHGYVYQPKDRSEFPPGLPPGRYKSVVETKLASPCFWAGPNGKATVFGAVPWPTTIVGYGKRG